MKLLKEQEETLDRNLPPVRKELACVKMEDSSLMGSHRKADDKIEALAAVVGSTLKTLPTSAEQNLTQVAQSFDAAFSDQWKKFMEQSRMTKARIVDGLKTFVVPSDVGIHREIAKSVATLPNRLSAIMVVGFEVALSAKSKNRNEFLEGDVGTGAGSGVALSNFEDSTNSGFLINPGVDTFCL